MENLIVGKNKSDKVLNIRKASPDDARYFVDLILESAPSFFPTLYGSKVNTVMESLFRKPHNLFSFQHVYFAEVDNKIAGMILGYDWISKKLEDWYTGFLLMKYMKIDFIKNLPLLLKAMTATGWIHEKEYYISNIAVFSKYRGKGIGTVLMSIVENEAKKKSFKKTALDVEAENLSAIRLYQRLGYHIIKESSVKLSGKLFRFYRMHKEQK